MHNKKKNMSFKGGSLNKMKERMSINLHINKKLRKKTIYKIALI
jgi:hypothetical protein